jgi:TPR repeat protein
MRYSLFVGALLAGIATAGSATARDNFKTGSTAYSVGLYGSAARHWLALAQKGDPPAQYNVGRMLYYGQGMRRDQIEAYKWFLIARDNGVRRSAEAARILGERLLRHQRVEAMVRARDCHRKNTR